jgi:hypothetical protein
MNPRSRSSPQDQKCRFGPRFAGCTGARGNGGIRVQQKGAAAPVGGRYRREADHADAGGYVNDPLPTLLPR